MCPSRLNAMAVTAASPFIGSPTGLPVLESHSWSGPVVAAGGHDPAVVAEFEPRSCAFRPDQFTDRAHGVGGKHLDSPGFGSAAILSASRSNATSQFGGSTQWFADRLEGVRVP